MISVNIIRIYILDHVIFDQNIQDSLKGKFEEECFHQLASEERCWSSSLIYGHFSCSNFRLISTCVN